MNFKSIFSANFLVYIVFIGVMKVKLKCSNFQIAQSVIYYQNDLP